MFSFYKSALQGVLTNPLCAEYRNEWRACGEDKEKLVKLALRQQSLPYFITHCQQGKGLSKEYLISEFGDYINEKRLISDADGVAGYTYSLFVGYNGICKPNSDVSAFMWCDCATLDVETTKCPIIYVGCNTELHITCNGYNSVRIYLFDNSRLVIDDADETCSFVIYKYSDESDVDAGRYCLTNNLKAFRKELKL